MVLDTLETGGRRGTSSIAMQPHALQGVQNRHVQGLQSIVVQSGVCPVDRDAKTSYAVYHCRHIHSPIKTV